VRRLKLTKVLIGGVALLSRILIS